MADVEGPRNCWWGSVNGVDLLTGGVRVKAVRALVVPGAVPAVFKSLDANFVRNTGNSRGTGKSGWVAAAFLSKTLMVNHSSITFMGPFGSIREVVCVM